MERRDIMVDIETLGVKPGQVIMSIALVCFDPFSDKIFGQRKWNVDIRPQVRGVVDAIDPDTLLWWLKEAPRLLDKQLQEPTMPVHVAKYLTDTYKHFNIHHKDAYWWGHGKEFDLMHLQNFVKRWYAFDVDLMDFRKMMDTRTLYATAIACGCNTLKYKAPDFSDLGDVHDPMADAFAQLRGVQHATQFLYAGEARPFIYNPDATASPNDLVPTGRIT